MRGWVEAALIALGGACLWASGWLIGRAKRMVANDLKQRQGAMDGRRD